MDQKTDNADPTAKLELRRYFLRKYHADSPPDVLDCCQGGGLLWRRLRDEFEVATYWGVDVKPKKGRLKLDSTRILAQSGWPQNVVDIDTYGAPWKHWEAMLPNVSQPTTVFLTIGQIVTGLVGRVPLEALAAIGLKDIRGLLPVSFHVKLSSRIVSYALARAYDYGIITIEAVEASSPNHRNVRYIGIRLEPSKKSGQGVTPSRSNTEPVKEVQNV